MDKRLALIPFAALKWNNMATSVSHLKDLKPCNVQHSYEVLPLHLSVQRLVDTGHHPLEHSVIDSFGQSPNGVDALVLVLTLYFMFKEWINVYSISTLKKRNCLKYLWSQSHCQLWPWAELCLSAAHQSWWPWGGQLCQPLKGSQEILFFFLNNFVTLTETKRPKEDLCGKWSAKYLSSSNKC